MIGNTSLANLLEIGSYQVVMSQTVNVATTPGDYKNKSSYRKFAKEFKQKYPATNFSYWLVRGAKCGEDLASTALLMTAIASKAGASIQIFPSWDSFTGIERECFYVSKSGSISEYVVTILGDVEAFDQAFEAMGYNRSNPLGFKINGSHKKIFF